MIRSLIIDDDCQIRQLLRQILELEGHDVLEASDGRDVERVIEAARVDLVVTDLHMPGRNGFEVLAMLRKLKNPPRSIVVSGSATPLLDMAGQLGAGVVLRKPFSVKDFRRAIRNLVNADSRAMLSDPAATPSD